jgi:TorA maturation chaperone TorD
MTASAPRNPRRRVDDRPPDLAALMMARAMAEMFRDEPDSPLPEPLAALLRQMERWRKEQGKHDG